MRYLVLAGALSGMGLAIGCGDSESHSGTSATGGSASGGAGSPSTGGVSNGPATGGSGNATSIPVADLCPVFTKDLCVYLMQCQGARYRDAEHCERELDCFGLPALLDAVTRGAVGYDPSQVGVCHERFIASPCTFGAFLFTPDIYEVLAWCPGTITPKLQVGERCSSHGECVDGLYCYKGLDYACPGQCRVPSELGGDCAGSARCAPELRCEDDICQPEMQPGDSCDGFCDYSVTCVGDAPCPKNLWCDGSIDQCQSGRLENEACGSFQSDTMLYTADCAINLWCDAVVFGTGVCRTPSAVGGPCNQERSACQDGLHCVGAVELGVDARLGTCEPPGASGGECIGHDDCRPGLNCNLGQCQPPAGEGAECFETAICQAGLVCADGLCVDARYPGEPCDGTRCTFSRCVAGTCAYHAKVGEACASIEDCATGECVGNVCYDDSVCIAPAL